jgi:hypothetical protein
MAARELLTLLIRNERQGRSKTGLIGGLARSSREDRPAARAL